MLHYASYDEPAAQATRSNDAHHRRATAEGAQIQNEPEDMMWGDRRYEALDLEGHRWHFAQRRHQHDEPDR